MSRVIVLNDVINFEPEKKNFNSRNAHVHISAPASYCFQLLIEKQGELVTHEEFYQYAWRQFGMEATANTLYQNISLIRRGLETCGLHEDIIRTMPRRGFILSPAVKIQYTRTRDLMEQQAVVESFGDKPIPEKTKPELLAEKLSEPDQTAKLDVDSPLKKKPEPESFKKVPDQKHFFEHLQVEPFRHIACGRALLHIWYYIVVTGAVISSIYLVFSCHLVHI